MRPGNLFPPPAYYRATHALGLEAVSLAGFANEPFDSCDAVYRTMTISAKSVALS